MFGEASLSFKKKLCEHFPWLEYSIKLDAAFCFACHFCINSLEPSFFSVGFRDWKHATGQKGMLTTYSNGKYDSQAMVSWKEYETRVTMGESIGCQLDRMGSKVIRYNRKYVLTIMEAVLYCTEQGLPLHGHDESHDSLNPVNFRSLVNLPSRHSSEVSHQLQEFSGSATWLSPSFHNEIISFMSNQVYSFIKQELYKAKFFTVLAD